MEFRDIDDVDDFDLTSPALARPVGGNDMFSTPSSTLQLTSEGFEGGFGEMEAEEYGKPTSRLSEELEEMDVSEEGCDTLFYLPGPDSMGFAGDKKVCCGVISSGQGIRRFCTLSMPEGEKTCGMVSHFIGTPAQAC
jgi:hypothetical protein